MSTNKKMLGKESNKKNAHRRYSLLLLALLFIGFATYGTYAYFTSSTSTTKGHLTLNGAKQYTLGTDSGSASNQNGIADSTSDTVVNPASTDSSGNSNGDGSTSTVGENGANNFKSFHEFDWIYVGNKEGQSDLSNLLVASDKLTQFNKYVTETADGTVGKIFSNVTGGDIFRKTVRLKVNGDSTIPATAKIEWKGTDTTLNNVTGALYYRKAAQTTLNSETTFNVAAFAEGFDFTATSQSVTLSDKVKAGDYIDVELVVMVKDDATATNLLLAKIARQVTITLAQDTMLSGASSAAQSN
ncbi:hypothetical protein [Enterococcus columbae]|uniref:Uncharacterized protein n=1 Tax=Enterococcus columbae DSM 7374 = ATCC 51263 TaxID=1121865 RepID=S1N4Y6_9ENTE|nr:hypothetical protein [Enterococcus columbae]EOT40337.1 hypothetical protein OMW_01591 [Enterococcus columbae DSM 7374 = ATCC 51263]EOW84075.1 hypothetical protein I568_01234 [Enterococcus columbae DSM 7374 = ATCC 51263]OJG25399.1 hypothetical protein RR47_GL001844 [Enterococcus columbae DSM 7374 = ATCC 51263]